MIRMTRRSMLGGAAALAAAATLEGGSARAQENRVLVIACQNDIANFDPHIGQDDPTTLALRNTYDTLIRVAGKPPKLIPSLAVSWSVSEDGLRLVEIHREFMTAATR